MALRVPHRLFPAAAPKSIITPRATAVSVNQIQGLPSLHSPALRFPTTCAASPFSAASLRFCCSCSGSTQQPQTRQKLQWQSLSQLQSQARTRLESHRRTMAATSTSAPASAAASTPTVPTDVPIKYAEGEDVRQLSSEVKALVDNGWRIDEEGVGVKKAFYFKGYFKAVSFVNFVAAESAAKKHHAVMTVRIGSVDVYWTTHHPRGLTHKDTSLARHCDKGAELMGSVEEGQGQKCGPGPGRA